MLIVIDGDDRIEECGLVGNSRMRRGAWSMSTHYEESADLPNRTSQVLESITRMADIPE